MMPPIRGILPGVADLQRCPHCGKSLRYLTVPEAAAALGVHRNTIQRWIREGLIRGAVKERVAGGTRYLLPIKEVNRLARTLTK